MQCFSPKMQGQRQVCDHTVGAKEQLMKDWDENWKIYAVETENQAEDGQRSDEDVSNFADQTDDALKASFYGIRDAYEKEHMDLDDKKQLMESYARSMERLVKSITDRNLPIERMEKLRTEGQLFCTEADVIGGIRHKLEEMTQRADAMQQQLTSIEADKNRLFGSVTSGSQCN